MAHGETIQAAHTLLLSLASGTCRHAGFITDQACITRERDVFGQAGALLAAWHSVEPPRDTPDITAWHAARGEQWLHLAEPVLPAEQRADIRAYLRDLTELGPLPLMPCHLDFTPRNLLYGPEGTLSVLDFEHARYDLIA